MQVCETCAVFSCCVWDFMLFFNNCFHDEDVYLFEGRVTGANQVFWPPTGLYN